MKKILILGGTTFDHIVTLDKFPEPIPKTIHSAPFHEATGSTGAGKALCLTKLGVPNVLHSILGDDIWGKKIITHLLSQNVDFIYDIDPKGTERHFNLMNAAGERISMFITQSSENPIIDLALIEEKIQWADIIVLNIIPYCKQIIPILQKYNKPVWTDLHDYDEGNPYHEAFINASQYIFLSSDNVKDYKNLMQQFIRNGKELVVCTHGKNGASILTKEGVSINQPAITSFALVDANGAGDNFFGGFLYAFIQGKAIDECMQYGTICGSYCIRSKELVHDDLSADKIENDSKHLK